MAADPALRKRVVRIVFISLVLDLLAFTLPLPLFPRIIDSFMRAERHNKATLLSRTLALVRSFRSALISFRPSSPLLSSATSEKYDLVLLGGLLGSLFSFCQFLISPSIGSLSDAYGRRPILLLTLLGNIASAALWLGATSFGPYLASRAVGGLSEGNVQLAIAIISDVSSPATRGRALALVGIAFSVCFTLGPSLGAWFATGYEERGNRVEWAGVRWNDYAAPAAVSLGLLVVETLYLAWALPETRSFSSSPPPLAKPSGAAEPSGRAGGGDGGADGAGDPAQLRKLGGLHLLLLFLFSGAEFTLTFLTFDLLSFSSSQNGRLLSFVGVLSSLLQGGYTRRSRLPPLHFVRTGVLASALALALMAFLPSATTRGSSLAALYGAAACLAYASATVVNSLNTLASLAAAGETRGEVMGKFRSAGQLGRALGPVCATGVYWALGPGVCYAAFGLGMLGVYGLTSGMAVGERKEVGAQQTTARIGEDAKEFKAD